MTGSTGIEHLMSALREFSEKAHPAAWRDLFESGRGDVTLFSARSFREISEVFSNIANGTSS